MKLIGIVAMAVGIALPDSAIAQTGTEQQAQVDALGQCLTMKSTGSDRIAFAGWMVAAMASAPQLKGLAVVSQENRENLNRDLARIFTRLVTIDCRDFTRPLMKAGNTKAFSSAFEVFGRLAMQELTGNPEAEQAMGEFSNYINEADFADLKK